MSKTLTVEPRREFHTMFDSPLVLDLDTLGDIGAHIAFLGLPFGAPYSMEDTNNDQSNAPTAIRRVWQRALRGRESPVRSSNAARDGCPWEPESYSASMQWP